MKRVAENRRAKFDYEITETVEAGIVLTGQEVKSCRAGHASLAGAYVSFLSGKAVLKNAQISPYPFARTEGYDPKRDRLLLLTAPEIHRLQSFTETKGMTVVPMELRAGKFIKVLLGAGRGRKKIDKRHRIREREQERDIRRGGS